MNFRLLLKSMKLAFRSTKRVLAFIIIYAFLFVMVGKSIERSSGTPGEELWWLIAAFVVAAVYAVLIAQFRRRDIAILKCVSWSNAEIMLLLAGEVVIVATTAFLLVLQLSIEILGIVAYFETDFGLLSSLRDIIVISPRPMFTTLFYIAILQLVGLFFGLKRAMSIPPMKALREE
ncbi:MAG: hypothetical protein QXS20_06125 [Candidatus Thorarchaeota archaeon]